MQNEEDLTNKRISSAMRALPRDRFIEMNDSSLVLGRSIPPPMLSPKYCTTPIFTRTIKCYKLAPAPATSLPF